MVTGFDLVSVPCPLCETTDVAPSAWLRDVALGVPGEFALARCRTCGLWQQNPRVRDEQLAGTYPDHYPRHAGEAELPKLLRLKGPAVRAALATRLGYVHLTTPGSGAGRPRLAPGAMRRIVEHFPPWIGQGRLLDVGCATGSFLRSMRAVGWNVSGIEIDAEAAAKARSVTPDIFEGDPVDAPFLAQSFDVVTSFHVIEHLPQPRAALARMLEWLAPDGVMIVEVPNIAGVGGRVFGRYWSGLDFPRHLIHFTAATMTAMVERAGGRVVDVRHRTKPRWLIWSLRHWLRDQRTPIARAAGAGLETALGRGIVKVGLETLLPLARRAGLGEMAQYIIRHR